ncbi:Putative translation factor [Pseudooceanicola batsensis HTCC2597]|uniref:Threonylcarbamoyl-AMP synthase n=1 Tax=Pseudooceanicola batsensis (strain ATCC BAA-863 / DSM 15984 / KCTC 12145 / HTCC2597) TaxID=252305 RepID=A3TV95_PSEBH|nr:L-threonylcarbamoyladenylate synthase [Pseudooceanicola batsensis]EAQ04441.1 Putative translation factor [Pseudooceanicola batsensis HTCC2597]
MTELLKPTDDGLDRAAALLRSGGLVAMPTETVYGLAGDAADDRAVAAIYAAKGRPSFNPLIVHVADPDLVGRLVRVSAEAAALIEAFWPGPLTLVLPLREAAPVSPLVTAGLPTLAVRMPAHPVARSLLTAFGGGLAAPSANPSGRVSPVTAAHVMAGLAGRIDAVLDGGECGVGLESTIVGFDGDAPVILRDGGVTAEDLASVMGETPRRRGATGRIDAPGQLASHYAPSGQVRIGVTAPEPGETYLGFGPVTCDLNLSETGDLAEAAANLFRHFHTLDAQGSERIAVAPVPDHGLGRAINDRLRRAAAPRQA